MKANKSIVWLMALLVIGSIVAVVVWPDGEVQESGSINLRLKWIWYSGWAGELLAEHEDTWTERGLTVSIRPGGFELDPIKLVASGSDHIGVAGADRVLFARKNGVPLVAFAAQYQQSPVGFVSLQESEIRTIRDFKGHRIGVKYGTDVEPIYRALLAQAGLTKTDVTEVPVKFDLAPLFSGAIDVYPGYLTNDLLIPQEKGYSVNTISAPAEGMSVYGNVYFCSEEFLRTRPEQLVAFLGGIRHAWKRALAVPPSTVVALAIRKNDGLNEEHEVRVVESLSTYVLTADGSFGDMTDAGWEQLYTVLREQEVIDTDFDYRRAYTLDILARARDGAD